MRPRQRPSGQLRRRHLLLGPTRKPLTERWENWRQSIRANGSLNRNPLRPLQRFQQEAAGAVKPACPWHKTRAYRPRIAQPRQRPDGRRPTLRRPGCHPRTGRPRPHYRKWPHRASRRRHGPQRLLRSGQRLRWQRPSPRRNLWPSQLRAIRRHERRSTNRRPDTSTRNRNRHGRSVPTWTNTGHMPSQKVPGIPVRAS